MKYFLYARKSTDTEDKQVQSLEDQINVMKAKANLLGINIVDTFIEAKSAKAPGREEFNKMIAQIYDGVATGIIAWKIDRLSRNPIDTGTIQYMLQTGKIDKIITNDREYNPVDAGLLMSVETGMANQYILDLSKNVKRGMDSKTAKGMFCGQAPEGYLNDKENKTIIVDDKNFTLIRKVWDFLLSGNYTIPVIVDMLNSDYGYKSNKKGCDKITAGGLYSIFKNVFYTGNFMWKGVLKNGIHTSMITFQEFEKAQEILGKKWTKVRPKTLEFAYSGIMRCGGCGSSIVGTQKTKTIKTTGEEKTYIYYHCSKRKKGCNCSQKRITLETLETQINTMLENIEIVPEFRDWALDILKNDYKEEFETNKKIKESLETSLKSNETKLEKLLDLLIEGKIDDKTYNNKKEEIQGNINIYKGKLSDLEFKKDTTFDIVEDVFEFITLAKDKFNNGDLKMKKTILNNLGENFKLLDGILYLYSHCFFKPIEKHLPEIKRIYQGLEPTKKGISLLETNTNFSFISLWSEGPGLNWHTQGLKP